MNGPFVVAQAGSTSSSSTAAPVQIIKVIKPPAGHTEVFHASYNGTVKIDFTAIANEKITLYHDNTDQTLHIIFTDGSQAIIEPFFDSMGVLSNMMIEVAPNQDLTGAQFAAQFPITEDQTVLPAAGPGTPGTPASGADFQDVSVPPFELPTPLSLLPPEELPPIVFHEIVGAVLPGTAPAPTTITVTEGIPLVVDESFIPGIGSQQPPSGSNIATKDQSSAFSVSGGGGTTTYALTINNPNTGLIDSMTGTAVTLVQNGAQEVDGKDGSGDVVFTLKVDSSGNVTMTDLRGVHEDGAANTPNDAITLASNLVSLTATNGAASGTLDLGSLITILDDGPVATNASLTGSVDEDGLPAGIAAGDGGNISQTITAGNVSTLFLSGADAPLHYSFTASLASLVAEGLSSGGTALTYAVATAAGVETLTASAGATTVSAVPS
jgi:hypothetical protein